MVKNILNLYALDCLLVEWMLLEMTADANNVDEIINSPEIKPNRPVVNIIPVKISLLRLFIVKVSLV